MSKLDAWIKKILDTEPEEISCSDCFEMLPGVVEADVLQQPAPPVYLKVKQHLRQCQVCREEYEILRDLTQMDAKGGGEATLQDE